MDLKVSLVNTHLRIYPTENFTNFLKSIPDDEDIPINILKIIGKNCKDNLNENVAKPNTVHLTDEDLKNIKSMSDYVKAIEPPADLNISTEKNIENEKEKSGDTPEKHVKDSTEKKVNKPKKKKNDIKDDKENIFTDKKDFEKTNDAEDELEKNNDTEDSKEENNDAEDSIVENIPEKDSKPFLLTSDIDWLYFYLQKRRSKGDNVPYLHTLIEGVNIEMPENKMIKRNPELEARCVKLRAQAEARAYRKMTKGVDNVRMRFPEDSISYQMKQLNRHLIAVGQFILSIFAGFMFGFKGIEWSIGYLEFGFRLLLGVMCALVIALAEIYFLAKKLNEELSVPETVQLGGPVKFVDEPKYRHLPSKPLRTKGKEHQD